MDGRLESIPRGFDGSVVWSMKESVRKVSFELRLDVSVKVGGLTMWDSRLTTFGFDLETQGGDN